MADSFKFSLYEVFGYLLPGTLALSGLTGIDILVFHHGAAAPSLGWVTTKSGVATVIFLSYIAGHAVQIGATHFLPKSNTSVLKNDSYASTKALLEKVQKRFADKGEKLADDEVITRCDSLVICAGPAVEREIYVYREGFYRGCTVALALIGFLGVLTLSVPIFLHAVVTWGVALGEIVSASALCIAVAVGMYYRSLRFANYRLSLCLSYYFLPKALIRKSGSVEVEAGCDDKDDGAETDGAE